MIVRVSFFLLLISLMGSVARSQELNRHKMLDHFDFWHNKDWTWYRENIPFLETSDSDIDLTW